MSGQRSIRIVLAVAAMALIAVAATFAMGERDLYARELRPIYAIIEAGEQNWADEATQRLHAMIARAPNRHALADRLLDETNGSLVAEGMVLAVRSGHPRARAILQAHLTDNRWNWGLASNKEVAGQLLFYLDDQPTQQWVLDWLGRTAGVIEAATVG